MLLSKQIAVYLNLSGCRLKQYMSCVLKKNNIDLTPEQFLVLDILWNQGSMSQQQMADTLMKDKNSITKLVNALEKKRLVTRVPDSNDRRSNLLALTPGAENMKEQTKEIGIDALDRLIGGIPEEALNTFLYVLSAMDSNMEAETR